MFTNLIPMETDGDYGCFSLPSWFNLETNLSILLPSLEQPFKTIYEDFLCLVSKGSKLYNFVAKKASSHTSSVQRVLCIKDRKEIDIEYYTKLMEDYSFISAFTGHSLDRYLEMYNADLESFNNGRKLLNHESDEASVLSSTKSETSDDETDLQSLPDVIEPITNSIDKILNKNIYKKFISNLRTFKTKFKVFFRFLDFLRNKLQNMFFSKFYFKKKFFKFNYNLNPKNDSITFSLELNFKTDSRYDIDEPLKLFKSYLNNVEFTQSKFRFNSKSNLSK
jgi:hypothetical protein